MIKQIIITFLLLHVVVISSQNHKDTGNLNTRSGTFNGQFATRITQNRRVKVAVRRTSISARTDRDLNTEDGVDKTISPQKNTILNSNTKETPSSQKMNVVASINNKKMDLHKIQNNSSNVKPITNLPTNTNVDKSNMNSTDDEFPDRLGTAVIITLQGRGK